MDYSGGREGQEAGQALPIPQMLDILDKSVSYYHLYLFFNQNFLSLSVCL